MYRIFIITSNDYLKIASGCSYLFNKFFSEGDVTFLGYDIEPKLYGSHKFVSMGNQKELQTEKRYWTVGPKKFFNSITDEYIVIGLDDYWLLEKPIYNINKITDWDNADKIDFEHVVKNSVNIIIGNSKFGHKYLANQDIFYRTSMQLALWKKDYLMKFLDDETWTSYDFELIGSEKAINDGAKIIGFEKDVFHYQEVIHKGKTREDSINILKRYGLYKELEENNIMVGLTGRLEGKNKKYETLEERQKRQRIEIIRTRNKRKESK